MEKNMDAVIHLVMLADLNCLAETWEISKTTLGLDISDDENLVPRLIGADDNVESVAEFGAVAERDYPNSNILDIVVQVHKSSIGNLIGISTIDQLGSPQAKACKSRWWRFTDEYVEQMQ
jgi:hypothetical protein